MPVDQSEHIRRLVVEYVRLRGENKRLSEMAQAVADQRKVVVSELLELTGGSKSEAARLLGVSATMVYRILSRDTERRKINRERDSNSHA